ncbi:MAG TPA: hypothetical protein VJU87_00025 [Gemmatimonadaceae bacterium]|nr:hypothetical protein [Gemmatimonadaceae bacterium]
MSAHRPDHGHQRLERRNPTSTEPPLVRLGSSVLAAAVLTNGAMDDDIRTAVRHAKWLKELNRFADATIERLQVRAAAQRMELPTAERESAIAEHLRRAIRAGGQPAHFRLATGLVRLPDRARHLSANLISAAAPLQDAVRCIGNLALVRSYAEETEVAVRRGEELYLTALGSTIAAPSQVGTDADGVLDTVRTVGLLRAFQQAHAACSSVARYCTWAALAQA